MFNLIRENIRSFLDITLIITMIAIGAFTILIDYKYFKRMKFKKDAAASLGVGITFLLLPFALLLIARL